MNLARFLKNSGTMRDCELSFVVLSTIGLLCMIALYVACLLEGFLPKLFLAAIAYCVPGAVVSLFGASLYFSRWLSLQGGRGGANAASYEESDRAP